MIKKRFHHKLIFNNKILLYGLICILVLVFFGIITKTVLRKEKSKEISQEDKCVLQTTTCCGCEMGGKQDCMTKEEAKIVQEKLEKECPKDLVCIAMYACENVSCEYKDGKCQKAK